MAASVSAAGRDPVYTSITYVCTGRKLYVVRIESFIQCCKLPNKSIVNIVSRLHNILYIRRNLVFLVHVLYSVL